MNFTNHEHKRLASKEDILALISDVEIYDYYLGGIPKKLISSPMREDKVPSFGLFHSQRYGKTFFKDFATGDSGDVFVFVRKLFNLSSLPDACNKIVSDFNLNEYSTGGSTYNIAVKRKAFVIPKIAQPNKIEIKVKVRPFDIRDKEYWMDKYGINKNLLKESQVYPISHYFLNDYCVKVNGLAYAYVENKDGKQTFKIYQPFEKENKWINNNNYSIWELWSQISKVGKRLIITSSRKDAMVINSLFDKEDLCAVSLQGENFNPKQVVMDELEARFDEKFILYDNDFDKQSNWGRIAAEKIAKSFPSFTQIELNEISRCKDISDFREMYGEEMTRTVIKTLVNYGI